MRRLPLLLIVAALTIAPLAAAEYYEGKPECPPDHMCTTSMPSDGSEWSCPDGQVCTTSVDNGCTSSGSGETTPAEGEGSTGSGEATPSGNGTEPATSNETSVDPAPSEREPQPENGSAPVEEEPAPVGNETGDGTDGQTEQVPAEDGEGQVCTTSTDGTPTDDQTTGEPDYSGCSEQVQCPGAPASGANNESTAPQEEREATGNQPPVDTTSENADAPTQGTGADQAQQAADAVPADTKTVPGVGIAAALAALGAALLVMRRSA